MRPNLHRTQENGTGRRAALSRKVVASRHELGDVRRGSVYKTDPALFTGYEDVRRKRLPKAGSPERRQLEDEVLRMLRDGEKQAAVAARFDVTQAWISGFARKHGLGRGQKGMR